MNTDIVLAELQQLEEKLNDELKKWNADFKHNSAYMISLMDIYYLQIVRSRYIKYFGDAE